MTLPCQGGLVLQGTACECREAAEGGFHSRFTEAQRHGPQERSGQGSLVPGSRQYRLAIGRFGWRRYLKAGAAHALAGITGGTCGAATVCSAPGFPDCGFCAIHSSTASMPP